MPISEFWSWVAYIELYGPVSVYDRIDHAAALVSFTVSRANGSKTEYRQFLQHPAPSPIDDSELNDLDRLLLGGLKQPGQNRIEREPH
jgi:hypothetical protein